jgi:MFS family permease
MSIAPADTRRSSFAALAAAFLGWMFDGFEMGLFPYVGKPALQDLLSDMGSPAELKVILDNWFSVIIATFLVGAATGGVFFGWLGDRIGRVRAMSISIFVYAIFTGLCGFATEAWHIAILRFVASLGMGGEWALGVALVNELWQGNRAWVAGAIGAAANIGYILVGLLGWAITQYSLPALLTSIGVSESIADVLGVIWEEGAVPQEFATYRTTPVPKSGKPGVTIDPRNPDDCRPITCGNVFAKILGLFSLNGLAFDAGQLAHPVHQ